MIGVSMISQQFRRVGTRYLALAQRTRHEYRLSAKGLDLYPVLMALRAWGDKYLAPDGEFVIYRHRDCGGRTAVQHVCDQCGADVTAHDIEPTPGPGLAVIGLADPPNN
jgi:HxlR-like helix-turn-helix